MLWTARSILIICLMGDFNLDLITYEDNVVCQNLVDVFKICDLPTDLHCLSRGQHESLRTQLR